VGEAAGSVEGRERVCSLVRLSFAVVVVVISGRAIAVLLMLVVPDGSPTVKTVKTVIREIPSTLYSFPLFFMNKQASAARARGARVRRTRGRKCGWNLPDHCFH
jgi:hypothetical protein